MKRSDLIIEMRKRGMLLKDAREAVEIIAAIAKEKIGNNEPFTVPGVVKVIISDRAPRKVRNPATGETYVSPAKKVPVARLWHSLRSGRGTKADA